MPSSGCIYASWRAPPPMLVAIWSAKSATAFTPKAGSSTGEVQDWSSTSVDPTVWITAAASGTYEVVGSNLGSGSLLVVVSDGSNTYYPTLNVPGQFLTMGYNQYPGSRTSGLNLNSHGCTIAMTFSVDSHTVNGNSWYVSYYPWSLVSGKLGYGLLRGDMGKNLTIFVSDGTGFSSLFTDLGVAMPYDTRMTVVFRMVEENGTTQAKLATSATTGVRSVELGPAGCVPKFTNGRFQLFMCDRAGNTLRIYGAMVLPLALSDAQMQGLCTAMHAN